MDQDSVFNAKFIIDGLAMESTPSQLLEECSPFPSDGARSHEAASVIDETLDPAPSRFIFEKDAINLYIEKIISSNGTFPVMYPRFGARSAIASALTSCIWSKGHFRLDDIDLSIDWEWDSTRMGNMASFYSSVEDTKDYAGNLGIKISGFSYKEAGACRMSCHPDADECNSIDSAFEVMEKDADIWMGGNRFCKEKAAANADSWIIYIPFDTCAYRLGGSALSSITGNSKDPAPDIQDPDYFMDCFEVVREMVEDGILLSGTGVGRGGIVCAAARLCEKTGLTLDVSGICSAYAEDDLARILFAEVPGVIIQIRDSDYDYLDSQCLLQDIAYYTLGHPSGKPGEIKIKKNTKPQVSSILESLIASRDTSEGED